MKTEKMFFKASLLLAILLIVSYFFLPGANAQAAFQWVNGGGGNNGTLSDNPAQDAKLISADKRGHLYSFNSISRGGVHVDTFQRSGTYNNYSDLLLCSWSCDGKLRWARTMGDIYWENAYGIASDGNGNVYVCGDGGRLNGAASSTFKINDTLVSSVGGAGIFIAKYDSMGRMKWLKFPGANASTASTVSGRSMKMGADGKLCIYAEAYDFPGNQFEGFPIQPTGLAHHLYRFKVDTGTAAVTAVTEMKGITTGQRGMRVNSLEMDASGNTYMMLEGDTVSVMGETAYYSSTQSDFLIASFDNAGNARWAKKVAYTYNTSGPAYPQLALLCMQYLNNRLYLGGTMYRHFNYYGNLFSNPNQDTTQYCGLILSLNASDGAYVRYNAIKAGQGPIRGSGLVIAAMTVKFPTGELAYAAQAGGLTILNGTDTLKPTVNNTSGLVPTPVIIHNLNTQLMTGANLGANGSAQGSSITSDNSGNLFIGGKYQSGSLYTPNGTTLPYYGGFYNFFVARYGQPNGCSSCAQPRPAITSFIRTGQVVTVKGTTSSGTADSLVWVWGDGATTRNVTANAPVSHTYNGHQGYTLCLRAYSSCGTVDTCMALSTVSIAQQGIAAGIRIYPNPVHDYLNVEGAGDLLKLTDLTGKILYQAPLEKDRKMDLRFLAPGMYLYQVFEKGMIIGPGKFIKD